MKRVQLDDEAIDFDSIDFGFEPKSPPPVSSVVRFVRPTPPRISLNDDEDHLPLFSSLFSITKQPPLEIRTSKPKDKRFFSCSLSTTTEDLVCGIVFADDFTPVPGEAEFTNFNELQIVTPSFKVNDREFRLCFQSKEMGVVYSRKFYSYSNQGVLVRRRDVELVALGKASRCHVVGRTFFQSNRLAVVFRIFVHDQWKTIPALKTEWFSETVLFFEPPIEISRFLRRHPVFVQVTNNGRDFSNGLEFQEEETHHSARL